MIQCEICNNYIPESSVCPVCNAGLSVNINEDTNWVTVKIVNDEIFACMISTNLNRSEIPSEVLVQSDSTRVFTLGHLSQICIMVPEPYLNEALKVIQQIEDGAFTDE
jgi:hypothetical protein